MPRRLLAADRQGTAGPVVVVGSAPVVVGPVVVGPVVVGWVLVVVASVVVGAAVVVETVVVGEAVVGAATGGWVVALTVENASVIVVVSAVADTWAVPGPGALVGLLTARRGPVSEVRVETVGAVVGSHGPVVGATDLAAGSAGTVSSPRTGARRVNGGWGLSGVTEATRAARTPLVSRRPPAPASKATVTSSDAAGATSAGVVGVTLADAAGVMLAGATGVASPDAKGVTSSGAAGVESASCMVPVRLPLQGRHGPLPMSDASLYPVTRLAAFALSSAFDKSDAIRAPTVGSLPVDANANRCQEGRS
jgi:hypothetical protein